MQVEFNQGVPDGCKEWLEQNVGRGNMTSFTDSPEYDWFYERVKKDAHGSGVYYYVPTITVKDPKKAAWFVLRWSA